MNDWRPVHDVPYLTLPKSAGIRSRPPSPHPRLPVNLNRIIHGNSGDDKPGWIYLVFTCIWHISNVCVYIDCTLEMTWMCMLPKCGQYSVSNILQYEKNVDMRVIPESEDILCPPHQTLNNPLTKKE